MIFNNRDHKFNKPAHTLTLTATDARLPSRILRFFFTVDLSEPHFKILFHRRSVRKSFELCFLGRNGAGQQHAGLFVSPELASGVVALPPLCLVVTQSYTTRSLQAHPSRLCQRKNGARDCEARR